MAGGDAGFQPLDGEARRVKSCFRHDLLVDERLSPPQGRLRVPQARLVLGDGGFGLRDLRLHQAVVETNQHRPFGNEIPFVEVARP